MSKTILLRRRKELFFDDIKVSIDKDHFFLERGEKIEVELSEGEHTILIESYWCRKHQTFEVQSTDLEFIIERARYKYYIAMLICIFLLAFLALIIDMQQKLWIFTSPLLFYYLFLFLDMFIYRNKFFNIRIYPLAKKGESK